MIKKILYNKISSFLLIKLILKIHNLTYKLAAIFGTNLSGYHPKHDIIKYKEWFSSNISKEDIVLDIGCNTGMMVETMSFKAKYVYGIEIEEKFINQAKTLRQRDNISYICADATVFNYSELSQINVITLSNVLEHIEDRVFFLKNIISQINWKNLNEKKILIRVPMIEREWITLYKKKLGVEYRLDNTHYIEYTFDQFQREISLSGLYITSHKISFGEICAICKVIN